MIIDHRIKVDGEWYKAGDDVPALATKEPKTTKSETVETVEEPTVDNSVKRTYNRKK